MRIAFLCTIFLKNHRFIPKICRLNRILLLPLAVIVAAFAFSSCRKNVVDDNPSLKLQFSTDTLTFDTVFTTLASTTLHFVVYNKNANAVKTNVTLAGGSNSNFRINADGIPGDQQGLEIYGKDSTYVFVEVTVDPNGLNTPLIIIDSVIFETNGNRQKVILAAWGQDAFYFNDSILTGVTTWSNIKPYVIFNQTIIDSGATLNIMQGTQVHMGGNAQLIVLGTGKINVTGTAENPVVFQGVRLEEFYDDLPGQWSGIYILRSSRQNNIEYAIIKNSDFGINLGSIPGRIDTCSQIAEFFDGNAPQLTLKNTIIQNSFRTGLGGLLSEISAENCLIFNAGDRLVSFVFGGNYKLNHCTLANYGSATLSHQTSALLLSNILRCEDLGGATVFPAPLSAIFQNTIVYGSLDEEISFDFEDTGIVDAIFDHCLLKTEHDDTLEFNECIFNLDPQFADRAEEDYTLLETSPCRDSGFVTTPAVFIDLKGNSRPVGPLPDIGAYEFQ